MLNPVAAFKKTQTSLWGRVAKRMSQQPLLHREYARMKDEVSSRTPNNPALFGYKVYSQFDEDGIIAHIFAQIGVKDRVFVEIGCGNGLENNTHALLLQGWRGAWIDASEKNISFIAHHLPQSPRLAVKQEFVSTQNASRIVSEALAQLGAEEIDFLSIDIDGDDLNVLKSILENLQPRVICAEYNAKFPPPMKVNVKPRPETFWSGDDYHGASLTAFEEALQQSGYRLISCGLSGVNAFFVRAVETEGFPIFSVEQLFQPAMFDMIRMTSGHPASLKFLADELARSQTP